jgi:hypothetical protein
MMPRRITIGRWMGLTAVLAVNAALVRAFVVQEMFCGGIVIALQIGFWCLLQSRGTLRRFWMGFEVCGTTAVLLLFSCELFPSSPLNRLVMSYTQLAADLAFRHLPPPLEDHLDEHWDLFLAVVYFVPELVAALLGGMIAALLAPRRLVPTRTMHRLLAAILMLAAWDQDGGAEESAPKRIRVRHITMIHGGRLLLKCIQV